jgi:hypothetical protein
MFLPDCTANIFCGRALKLLLWHSGKKHNLRPDSEETTCMYCTVHSHSGETNLGVFALETLYTSN